MYELLRLSYLEKLIKMITTIAIGMRRVLIAVERLKATNGVRFLSIPMLQRTSHAPDVSYISYSHTSVMRMSTTA